MKKILCVIAGPLSSRSGYGSHSRDIVNSIIKLKPEWDIRIIDMPWGSTPRNVLDDGSFPEISSRLLSVPNVERKPDIWIQITVPNEFQPNGVYNIGITAGIETNHVDSSWLEGCNRMNITLVSSEFAKKGFVDTIYERHDKTNPQMKVPPLKLEREIAVLFEGVDTNIYKKSDTVVGNIHDVLSDIKEDFCFLFVGHWLQGQLYQDRKDVGGLVKTFFESFKNKKNKPALILKTSSAKSSLTDRKQILDKIDFIRTTIEDNKDLPNVYLLHGDLTDEEMNGLYNHPKVKAHVSFTKGEGFGRPLLEASLSAKPIICPQYSGQVDFLEFAVWLPGTLAPIHDSAVWQGILNKGTSWFQVDYNQAGIILKNVFEHYKDYIDLGKRQAFKSKTYFDIKKMEESFIAYLNKAEDAIPKPVPIVLPKLQKIVKPAEVEEKDLDTKTTK